LLDSQTTSSLDSGRPRAARLLLPPVTRPRRRHLAPADALPHLCAERAHLLRDPLRAQHLSKNRFGRNLQVTSFSCVDDLGTTHSTCRMDLARLLSSERGALPRPLARSLAVPDHHGWRAHARRRQPAATARVRPPSMVVGPGCAQCERPRQRTALACRSIESK